MEADRLEAEYGSELDLLAYWRVLRRWLWLIALASLLAGATAFVVSTWALEPTYRATTRLIVQPSTGTSGTSYADILAGQRAATTYAEMLKSRVLLRSALSAMGYATTEEASPEEAPPAFELNVEPIRDTEMIDIAVESQDARFAAELANTLAETFIEQNQSRQAARYRRRLTQLEAQIAELEAEIGDLQSQIAATEDTTQRGSLEARLSQLRDALTRLSYVYQSLQVAELQAVDLISVVEPAEVPMRPVSPRTATNTALATVVGAMVATGAVFLMEYLDTSIKTKEEAEQLTGLPVLGQIWRDPALQKMTEGQRHPALIDPFSPTAEAFRLLRANLAFAAVDTPLHTILVTGTGPGEGKSITALNLAISVAATGRPVILVDADLRRPRLHAYAGVRSTPGLSDALVEHGDSARRYLQPIPGAEGVQILPPGRLPPNPAELLGSQRMRALIAELTEDENVLVVLDSPPLLAAADGVVLAPQVDGTLLIIEAGSSDRHMVMQALEQLHRGQARLLGVVLNKVPLGRRGKERYYYRYYHAAGAEHPPGQDVENNNAP